MIRCDMNSQRDIADLADVFGFSSEELLAQSPAFGQGQVLLTGGSITTPTIAQMVTRITAEGGGLSLPRRGDWESTPRRCRIDLIGVGYGQSPTW